MNSEEYRPDDLDDGGTDVVAFGSSIDGHETWFDGKPHQVLWLGETIVSRILAEAKKRRLNTWSQLEICARNVFDREQIGAMIRDLEVINLESTDDHVREGSIRILKRMKTFIADKTLSYFIMEGP